MYTRQLIPLDRKANCRDKHLNTVLESYLESSSASLAQYGIMAAKTGISDPAFIVSQLRRKTKVSWNR